ncbi:PAS domain S-box protein [Candidatus Halobeggiatoa sp. HSG11]|nr:PAS domain S-box protein [Candidatus Halobeggiatoa sp. HSG11]
MKNITIKLTKIESLIQNLSEVDGNTPLKQVQPQIAQLKTLVKETRQDSQTLADLNSITQNSPDHIVILDRELKVQFINHTSPDLTVEQVTGTPVYNYLPEGKRDRNKALLESVLTTNKEICYESEYVTSTGKVICYESRALPRIVNGQTVGILLVARDITEREQAKIALQKSKEQIELLLNSTAEGIYGIDIKGNCTFCNTAALNMLGYQHKEQLLNQSMHDLIHHSYKDGTPYPLKECPIYQAFREGKNIHKDHEVFWRVDGIQLPTEYWSYPIIQEGKITGAVITFIDISERQQNVAKTQQIATELTQLIDTANAPIFGIDKQGKVNEWNQSAQRITGYTKKDVFGHDLVKEFILVEYQFQVQTVLKNALRGKETSNYEFPLETKDGQRRMILLNATTRRDTDEQIIGVIGVGQDITERKEAECKLAQLNQELEYQVQLRTEELQATNEELQTTNEELQITNEDLLDTGHALDASRTSFLSVVDKNAAGIMVIDKQSIIQYFNPAMQQLFKHTPLEIGKEFAIPTHPGKRIEVLIILSENEFGTAEMDVVNTLWEEKPAYLLMLHDITDLKKAESDLKDERALLAKRVEERTTELSIANVELAQAARLKDKFLANMSHELRTPLNGILGMSDMLHEQFFGPLNEKQLSYVVQISKSGKHLLSLISDLLDTAKIDAGTMELALEKTAIEEIIATSISMMKSQFKAKNLQIKMVIDPTLPLMLVDIRKCKQIMLNLLSNAVKYTEKNGWIKVHVFQDSSMLKLIVSDNGMGIERKELDKIFSEFHQADRVRDQELGGTGIGLALTRRLVELHGGEIGVESELDKGSSFWFTIPIKTQIQITQDAQEKSKIANFPHNSRILVAEDNEVNLMTILDMLSIHDHQVAVAKNGQEAIDLAQTHNPELILMDIRMPVMNGMEATKRLRAMPQFKNTPIIALTASTGDDAEKKQIIAGCTTHLPKPVVTKELFAVLREYLD